MLLSTSQSFRNPFRGKSAFQTQLNYKIHSSLASANRFLGDCYTIFYRATSAPSSSSSSSTFKAPGPSINRTLRIVFQMSRIRVEPVYQYQISNLFLHRHHHHLLRANLWKRNSTETLAFLTNFVLHYLIHVSRFQ